MKFQTLCIIAFTALSLSACTLSPKNQSTDPAAFVIEQHKDIDAEPKTKHNVAQLLKHGDYCDIEFTAYLHTGTATEHWIFKDERLLSAFTLIDTEVQKKQIIFDPSQEHPQANFKALKSNFSNENLEQCNFK
ncbi:hypothetical protein [Acinetobacter shaoyimingii]|uniref:Uncharacterized protein n=1 Tax=Acinetobacter shaoyimingii TaxID=2715164 RepID=A0A6G8RZ20_9GAMM|nr:hypothetical protein [Acinetobacter shaoyimingii]QIO06983.1 hypothetical protein G8E00_14090 [Acinetobacter shaoyimingii]